MLLLLLSLFLLCFYLFNEKDFFTKILVFNNITGIVLLLICFISTFIFNQTYLDIAIIYFLLSFVVSCAYYRYFLDRKSD